MKELAVILFVAIFFIGRLINLASEEEKVELPDKGSIPENMYCTGPYDWINC